MSKLFAIDFETNGTRYFSSGFSVICLGVAWREGSEMRTLWSDTPSEIEEILAELARQQHEEGAKIAAYNNTFELGVIKNCYPHLWKAGLTPDVDVMRLVQLVGFSDPRVWEEDDEDEDLFGFDDDSGGGKSADKDGVLLLSLKAAVKRWLPGRANYEDEIKSWILKNCPGIKTGTWGAGIHQAPKDLLESYNVMDCVVTIELYELITKFFEFEGYDWRQDHEIFYLPLMRELVEAECRGIRVNREALASYAVETLKEIDNHKQLFLEQHAQGIEKVRLLMMRDLQRKADEARANLKTEKGRNNRKVLRYPEDAPEFNVNSKPQLAKLFVEIYGAPVKIWTSPKKKTTAPSPSFRSKHLHQWQGAEELVNVGNRTIVYKQALKLLELSESDGIYHVALRPCGTKTGRLAGTGGLNIQAISRRDKNLMSALLPPEGEVFISSDASSGEPRVITQLTKDKNYRAFTYDMVGKAPYYRGQILMIGDIYLALAAVMPGTAEVIRARFNEGVFDKWVSDKDYVLSVVKKQRTIAKPAELGLSYGMQGKKLARNLTESGHDTTEEEGYAIQRQRELLYPDIMRKAKQLAVAAEKQGCIYSLFGFRVGGVPGRKAFNATIQSSLNGVMALYLQYWLEEAPFLKFVTIIHDELIMSCPIPLVEDARRAKEIAQNRVNEVLCWDVTMDFGFVTGANLYEAK